MAKYDVTEKEFAYMTRKMSGQMVLALSLIVVHGHSPNTPVAGINMRLLAKNMKRFEKYRVAE